MNLTNLKFPFFNFFINYFIIEQKILFNPITTFKLIWLSSNFLKCKSLLLNNIQLRFNTKSLILKKNTFFFINKKNLISLNTIFISKSILFNNSNHLNLFFINKFFIYPILWFNRNQNIKYFYLSSFLHFLNFNTTIKFIFYNNLIKKNTINLTYNVRLNFNNNLIQYNWTLL